MVAAFKPAYQRHTDAGEDPAEIRQTLPTSAATS